MTVLVTGATGNIGRKVVDHLLGSGVSDIRALTTDPARAGLPEGVETAVGYLGRPETLPAALEGVDAMYLAPLPKTAEEVLGLARDAGVTRLVALSGGAHWQELADTVAASGIPAAQLGPGEFLENFAGWAGQIARTGTVREPYPDAAAAPIGMDDIARTAAVLLADWKSDHAGRMFPITGPATLTRAEIAEQIGVGIGREVRYEKCDRAEAEERLKATMGDYGVWYLDLIASSVDHPQQANALVEELTGVPAASVAEWARANAGLFS
ncbi:NmrA family NAD(P)-binding protein [Tsukamurella sp. 8F]|uniref:SDR family oxidoreductase n=1 Tax=unclassified Tsukamurella TaxID=2633480 RepID=UPI0023B9ACD0|nr:MULTISPECIES: NmrA family NAD(P)-binding protein [unclassified Tsukamurella]MDF0531961.1 NmrA family NAD(P)-binding protein [Tsukamurella sp. 8J]MDF0587988.1 NmrA family NAD(P)-binding protein [Tsukamurella sp. 8F]